MNGTVFLIGAGPGDPGLVTARAREVLRAAHVLIFDRLAAPELLALASDDCELVDAGKAAGDHTLTQDETNALLVSHAQAGRIVARLKGGDPFLFGRGGEEGAFCAKHRIPLEVIPGVSSAIAVPAYAGIPVTHRGVANHVTIVTASSGVDGTGDPDFRWLARSDGTVVLLMGLRRVGHIATGLIAEGAPPSRPTAVISRGTTPLQRTVVGTLSNIAERVEAARLEAPAIVVVGDVVSLRDTLDWFEQRPLYGRTIAVTRARSQASELVAMLSGLGAHVVECPTIRIEPAPRGPLEDAMANAGAERDFLVFTSRNGAELAFRALRARQRDSRTLTGVRVAVVGAGTAAVCRANGIEPDLVTATGQQTGQGLLEMLSAEPLWGAKVLVVRAEEGDERLLSGLRDSGADVELVVAYRNVVEQPSPTLLAAATAADMVTFSAASTVRNFARWLPEGSRLPPAVTIGPVTTAAAEQHGFRVAAEATDPSVGGLVVATLEVAHDALGGSVVTGGAST